MREPESYKKLYDDLKMAFGMMEKRLQDRIDYLKDANSALTVEKVELEKQLTIVNAQSRSLEKRLKSIADEKASITRLEKLIKRKDRDLEIRA